MLNCSGLLAVYVDIRFHVDSLLGLQLAAVFPDLDLQGLFGVDPKECAGLYTWFSQRGYYVGIAHAQRPSKLGSCGIACRWLEHVALTLRSHCRDSHRLRYKLMRGLLPQDFFFLVCRVSDWKRIAAMEQLEIRSRRPNANVHAQRPSGDLTCNKQRSRPPKLIRERAGSSNCGPFDAFDHAWCAPGVPHVDSPRLVHVLGPGPPSFDALYKAHVQRRYLFHGLIGALDIYAPEHRRLLITWCGTKAAVVDWACLEKKWNTGCGPAALSRALPDLLGKGRKALATRRINAALQARRLPCVRGLTCHYPRLSMLHVFRCLIRRMILEHGLSWNQDEKAWVCSRVRLVPGRLAKMRDAWNVPKVSKDPTVTLPNSSSEPCPPSRLRLIEKVWDVPRRPSANEDKKQAKKHACDICSALKLDLAPFVLDRHVDTLLQTDCTYQKEQGLFMATAHEYDRYTCDMVFDSSEEVLVPDDKNKKYMWILPFTCYIWFLSYFANIAIKWRLTRLTCEQADSWCWSVLDCLLNDRLKAFLGFGRYARVLPYCYGTIKSKCFQHAQWTCEKLRHSCFRKVVSCAMWPMRKRWRYVHRALELVMREAGGGDEIWSLRDAATIVDHRLLLANVKDSAIVRCVCGRCGADKRHVVILTADAGQFFEAVSPHFACSVVRTILAKAARITGKHVVTVLKNAKRTAFFGGVLGQADTSSYKFDLDDLYLAFASTMLINLCRIGNSVFHMGGLPIGGVLSKIAASYVLGHEEQLWAYDFAKRSSLGFAASSGSWACEVACARYVDDLFWVSTVYCHSCMAAALPHIYSVPFTVEPEACVVKWLDLHFSCTSLSWSMAPKKWAFPPCWGAEKNFLRSFLGGRFHRWGEVPLDNEKWVEALVGVLVDLKLAGWPLSLVRAAVFQVWRNPCRLRKFLLMRAIYRTWRH